MYFRPYVPGANRGRPAMSTDTSELDTSDLDQMQNAYKTAVEEWIAAIKQEEALASVNHSIAEIDKWEAAHFREDEIRSKVKAAKKHYEDALREKFFGF
jgi:energy-converting hydrogenase A subunit M